MKTHSIHVVATIAAQRSLIGSRSGGMFDEARSSRRIDGGQSGLALGNWSNHILLAPAQGDLGTLRGSGLQIVDPRGRVRASLSIQPQVEGTTETVLLRLIQPNGQPAVKISASMTGAGLSFVGGDDESYVILDADGPKTRLKMMEQNGREKLISP